MNEEKILCKVFICELDEAIIDEPIPDTLTLTLSETDSGKDELWGSNEHYFLASSVSEQSWREWQKNPDALFFVSYSWYSSEGYYNDGYEYEEDLSDFRLATDEEIQLYHQRREQLGVINQQIRQKVNCDQFHCAVNFEQQTVQPKQSSLSLFKIEETSPIISEKPELKSVIKGYCSNQKFNCHILKGQIENCSTQTKMYHDEVEKINWRTERQVCRFAGDKQGPVQNDCHPKLRVINSSQPICKYCNGMPEFRKQDQYSCPAFDPRPLEKDEYIVYPGNCRKQTKPVIRTFDEDDHVEVCVKTDFVFDTIPCACIDGIPVSNEMYASYEMWKFINERGQLLQQKHKERRKRGTKNWSVFNKKKKRKTLLDQEPDQSGLEKAFQVFSPIPSTVRKSFETKLKQYCQHFNLRALSPEGRKPECKYIKDGLGYQSCPKCGKPVYTVQHQQHFKDKQTIRCCFCETTLYKSIALDQELKNGEIYLTKDFKERTIWLTKEELDKEQDLAKRIGKT